MSNIDHINELLYIYLFLDEIEKIIFVQVKS